MKGTDTPCFSTYCDMKGTDTPWFPGTYCKGTDTPWFPGTYWYEGY